MEATIIDIKSLFQEAREKSEFEFVLTLLNYQGMAPEVSPTLLEWFDAIEFYKRLYISLSGNEKTRIGALLYSTFLENSDFYNIIGSLCRIKLGYRGSSYLFWRTRKYEKLLGIGEKQDFLIELLADAGKNDLLNFFLEKHHKEIRNTFFHAAYSLDETDYHLHDSEAIVIKGVGSYSFNIQDFFYPLIDDVLSVFENFKKVYEESWASYKEEKDVIGFFPNKVTATIIGTDTGLKGFKIKNAVQLFGKLHDSGIWYDEKINLWAGHNIRFNHANIETLEISDQLLRFESKPSINRSDVEFNNLIDKVKERRQSSELGRAIKLLVKFGDVRYQMMSGEENIFKKRSYPKTILPFYQKAVEMNNGILDLKQVMQRIKELE